MAGGAGQDKEMPDEVPVVQARIERVKGDPDRVRQAAGKEEEQTGWRHPAGSQRFDGDDNEPAHE